MDHPRLRGEYLAISIILEVILGSPPLTRGIQRQAGVVGHTVGITPAYAGNTGTDPQHTTRDQDHPRLRGEYPDNAGGGYVNTGSPPLTRGIHIRETESMENRRITPAYAGNTFQSVGKN